MGHIGSKSRSLGQLGQIEGNSCYTLEAAIFASAVVRMFVLKIFRSSSNMGYIGSETRSLGQIERKSC